MATTQLFATQTLADERNKLGITQQEMADLLSVKMKRNVSVWLYQKWEYGKRGVSTEEAVMISRELKQSVKVLWEAK